MAEVDIETLLNHDTPQRAEYHICTLSPNCEAYCKGDCENCGLFKDYLQTYQKPKGERAKTQQRIMELEIEKLEIDVTIAQLKVERKKAQYHYPDAKKTIPEIDAEIEQALESKMNREIEIGECEGYLIELDYIDGKEV